MMNTNTRKLTAAVLTVMMLAGCTATAASVQNDEADIGSKYTPVLTDNADAEKAAVDAAEKLLTGFNEKLSLHAGTAKDDLTKGITFDSTKVKSITVDDSKVDYNTPGTYQIEYSVEVYKSALPKAAVNSDSKDETQIVKIPAEVEIKEKQDAPAEQSAESTDAQQSEESTQPAASDNNGTSSELSGTTYEAPKAAVVPSQPASTPAPVQKKWVEEQGHWETVVTGQQEVGGYDKRELVTPIYSWFKCHVCGWETNHYAYNPDTGYNEDPDAVKRSDEFTKHFLSGCPGGYDIIETDPKYEMVHHPGTMQDITEQKWVVDVPGHWE